MLDPNSRYFTASETAQLEQGGRAALRYLTRRMLPAYGRADNARREYQTRRAAGGSICWPAWAIGDPLQAYRLIDADPVLHPVSCWWPGGAFGSRCRDSAKVVGTRTKRKLANGDSVQANQLGVRLVLWAGIVSCPVPQSVLSDRGWKSRAQQERRGRFSAHAAGGIKPWGGVRSSAQSGSFWWGAGSSSAC